MNRILKTVLNLTGAAALAALAVTAVVPSSPAVAAPSGEQARLDQAVAALRGIRTLKADFVQTDRSGQSVSGVLTLKRPGRIRFQYEKSVPMLIVGDGKALTLIDYEVNQVQRWPISNSPLGALLDPGRDVSKFGTLKPTGDPNVISVEVRDRKHPEYGVITLIFTRNASAPGGLELSYWVALDSQNKRTTVRLTNHRYGLDVPDSTFRWKDPRPRVRR
jgi:outer membrane lipoprotein-sorting protein